MERTQSKSNKNLKNTMRLKEKKRDIFNRLEKITSQNNEKDLDLIHEFFEKINQEKNRKTDSIIKDTVKDTVKNTVKNTVNDTVDDTVDDTTDDTVNDENTNVSRSFHNKTCVCFSCNIADLSNQLYYNCTNYVKKSISKDVFLERTIKAFDECYFIKNVISKKTHELIDIYKRRSQLYKQKYNDLLKRK